MAWIKRNLFFVVGGAVALLLLGAAGYYNYTSWSRNSAAFDKLNEIYSTLKNLTQQKPSPGNDRVNNTQIARDQEHQLHDWMLQTTNYFQRIAPIPNPVTGPESFANALHRTLDQLQHEAESANVALPGKYGFSFGAQLSLVKFADGSLEPLSVQLGEVKTISEILFAANINALDGVQRVRVSSDDAQGPPSDYLDEHSVTNDLAVVTPYVITFRGFSAEIGQVLAGFASSPHGFIVKGINIQPSGAPPAGSPPFMEGGAPPSVATAPVAGRGGFQTVLKEQLLRATMEVEVVKLLPKPLKN
jgi:hypothetical protein